MAAEQNFKNHARVDPKWHFFVMPVLLVNVVLSIYITVRDWPMHSRSHLWWIVMSFALLVLGLTTRMYSLAQQNRVIRLEERVRYMTVLAPAEQARAAALTLPQIIALRFASDAELPGLLERALKENLTPKQIKESVVTWRPDHSRI